MFEGLPELQGSNRKELDPLLKTIILEHLELLQEMELLRYFPDLDDSEEKIVRNPFSSNMCVENLPETMQDEFLKL